MFVQVIKSKKRGKVYKSYLIRESYRTEKGPRHRTVANITSLSEELREIITCSLKSNCSIVNIESLGLENALDFGGLAVLNDAWERFNLDNILEGVSDPLAKSRIKAMVFGRILFPGSKLSLQIVSSGTALSEACGLK